MFYIYLFKNLINGKIYIGETGNPKRRYKDHIKTANSYKSYGKIKKQAIHKAIAKYGENNFSYSIIDQFETEKEALAAEIDYIKKYKSKNKKYGYNLTPGGEGFKESFNKKLTNKQVIQLIKDYVELDISMRELSIKYNVSRDSIYKILIKENYYQVKIPKKLLKRAQEKRKIKDNSNKTTPKIISKIINDAKFMDNRAIADKYKLSVAYVRDLVNRKKKEKSNKNYQFKKHSQEFGLTILNDYTNGNLKAKELAEKYNISIDCIRGILSGQTIRHLNIDKKLLQDAAATARKNYGTKLDEEIIKSIFEKYATGNYTLKMLKDEFNLKSLGTIEFILKRETWEQVEINSHCLNMVNELLSNKYYFNLKTRKHILKQESFSIFLKNFTAGKSINFSANEANVSASFMCDVLKNKYWQDVPIDKSLYEKAREAYPKFLHEVFLTK